MKTRAAVLYEMEASQPYKESKPLKIESLELEDPHEHEVLLKIHAAGLCHSDLSVINGSRPRPYRWHLVMSKNWRADKSWK